MLFKRQFLLLLSALIVSLLITACSSFGDHSLHPQLMGQNEAANKQLPAQWQGQKNNSIPSTYRWGFAIPSDVQHMLDKLSNDNISLQVATIKRQQAGLDLELTSGEQLPDVKLSISSRRFETTSSQGKSWQGQYSIGANASWEVDLWQRLADDIKQKGALYQAQHYELEALTQSLQAQLLINWLNLIEQRKLLELNRKNVINQKRRLHMSEVRLDRGLGASIDVRNTKTRLLRLQEQQQQIIYKRDVTTRQLKRLLGEYPSTIFKASTTLPEFSAGPDWLTPHDILLNRPDVLTAEQKLIGAGYAWQASEKKRLPKLAFNFGFNSRQTHLADIFDLDTWLASVTSSLVQPIFYRGVLKTQAQKAQLQQQSAWLSYQNILMKAWQEVESAIQHEQLLSKRLAYLTHAYQQAHGVEQQVEIQYRSGLATSFELLSAQRTRTDIASDVIKLTVSRLKNRVQLQLALGLPTPASSNKRIAKL